MNFKSTLFPGVKTMTSTLRVRPPRDRVSSARKKTAKLYILFENQRVESTHY